MTISNILALKHRYRYNNASHVMLFMLRHDTRSDYLKYPYRNISDIDITTLQRYASRNLYYSTTPAVSISNSCAKT